MRLFLPSANPVEIRRGLDLGAIDGIVTNPSIIAREAKDYRFAVREAARLSSGPVFAQVLREDEAGIHREAKELSRIAENVVVRIPFSAEGLAATRRLTAENVRVDVNLVFSAGQALLAARAGATWVTLAIGRLDDAGFIGMDLVRDTVGIYDTYEMPTLILAGSIRHPNHVIEAALAGADAAAVPLSIVESMHRHPLSEAGRRAFLEDWNQAADQLPIKKVIRTERITPVPPAGPHAPEDGGEPDGDGNDPKPSGPRGIAG